MARGAKFGPVCVADLPRATLEALLVRAAEDILKLEHRVYELDATYRYVNRAETKAFFASWLAASRGDSIYGANSIIVDHIFAEAVDDTVPRWDPDPPTPEEFDEAVDKTGLV